MASPLALTAPRAGTPASVETGADLLPQRVLVVDDEPLVRGLLRTLLMHAGYRVETAENGAAALRQLEVNPLPDLIVLDLMMPELNGHDFRAIQQGVPKLAQIPVIVCSGEDPGQYPEQFPDCRWVEKPIRISQLLGAVRETLLAG